jgi:hypothetical protein
MKNLWIVALLACLATSLVAQRPSHPRMSPRPDTRPPAREQQAPEAEAEARPFRGRPQAGEPRLDPQRMEMLRQRLRERMAERQRAERQPSSERGRDHLRRPPASRPGRGMRPLQHGRGHGERMLRAAFWRGFAAGQRVAGRAGQPPAVRRR